MNGTTTTAPWPLGIVQTGVQHLQPALRAAFGEKGELPQAA